VSEADHTMKRASSRARFSNATWGRAMRGVGLLSCIGIAMLATGCSTLDERYTREGAGTDLYVPELADSARLQEIYVGYICQQAALSYEQIDGVLICREPALTVNWQVFVQAGMNDIDRRCDGYLTWLDNRRRWEGPIHQEILDTQATTLAILAATAVGPNPIAIVAAAFGLAAHSFTNFNSRLLFEVEKSTVQSVVLTRQQKYRETLPTVIDNRPAAIYALRQYLRLCMPMTIETQINTTVKLFERGGVAALNQSAAHPMIDARTVRSATITHVTSFGSGPDSSSAILKAWLSPGGVLDTGRKQQIQDFIGSDQRITDFLNLPKFAANRAQFIREHSIK
jgi:hypothetical protein